MLQFFFKNSIKRFIVFWVSTIVLACLLIAVVLLSTSLRLGNLSVKLILDSRAKEAALLLSNNILNQIHQETNWQPKDANDYAMARDNEMANARDIIEELHSSTSSYDEERLVDRIEIQFNQYVELISQNPNLGSSMVDIAAANLLASIDQLTTVNDQQIRQGVASHDILLAIIHRWVVIFIFITAATVAGGSVALTRRIIPPLKDLSSTASQFREGNFKARTKVHSDDEFGVLSRLFNDMADDIENREKTRHEFIAAVFHDIKNPILNLGGMVRLMLRKSLPPDQLKLWHERMLQEIERIDSLAQDLTDTVQVETGRLTLNMSELDLNRFVEEISTEQARVFTNHRLVYEHNGECRVFADSRRMERVVINLLTNAAKYSPEDSTITLRVNCRENRAVFEIADQGVGIASEDQKILFQPFGRLTRTQSMARGTGLGLYIVKKIVEAHGGTVYLESSPGAGTRVEISLPVI